MKQPRVLIVSPAAANANNGNWQTAWRWSRMLRPSFQADIAQAWNGEPYDVMLALHARRSADSIAAWALAQDVTVDARGLGVVLTGTDLYRDIQTDAAAQASLLFARRLVVLQECGPDALPQAVRHKARVIFQSVTSRKPVQKTDRHLRAVMVGHLRDEKSPQTLFEAARLLYDQRDFLIDHIGEALDAGLGEQARATADAIPNYRWLGGQTHEATRRRIQRAHLLVHASMMEGGAHVVMEAVCSGTPVLASEIAGNIGMLGSDYAGYFAHGDAQGLADLLLRCHSDQLTARASPSKSAQPDLSCGLYQQLQTQCAQRAHLFSPEAEQAALIKLVHELLT
ncbi:MAG TPA: selenoneine biosynthesis selenosugar synthase SenB [Burkholderiaceae bacterium]|nr:selenoneine biosynthesis selenosugar synthase SenB [Burkholderiaceae bacterium]HPH13336.1 selenoneine biosynthesis selenosugar synthase SenB [Burkholderiaceae bacterium]